MLARGATARRRCRWWPAAIVTIFAVDGAAQPVGAQDDDGRNIFRADYRPLLDHP